MSTENDKKQLCNALVDAELTKAKELIKMLQLEFYLLEKFYNNAVNGIYITKERDYFTPRSLSNSITSLSQQIIEKKETIIKYVCLAMLQPGEKEINEQ